MKYELCREQDLEPGQMRTATAGQVAVIVIRKLDGSFRALRDRCPHRGARLSRGLLQEMIDGEQVGTRELRAEVVVRCPWHGYEFDVDSGRCPADPSRVRVKSYPVTVEDGRVLVER